MDALNEYIKMCSMAKDNQQQENDRSNSSGSSSDMSGPPIYMPMISGSSTRFTGALAPMNPQQQQERGRDQQNQQQID